MNSAVEIGDWKRHRGGKQPVDNNAYVEVRLRCGDSQQSHAQDFIWPHNECDHAANLMKYRVISQPQAEEVEVKDTNIGTISYKISVDQIAGPLAWRDTIIHCQAIIEDCEREIERNVQLLDAEGLMMQKDSKKAMQHYVPDVDVNDYKNWSCGDSVIVGGGFGSYGPDHFESGSTVTDVDLEDTECPIEINGLWFTRSELLSDVKRS